MSISPLKHGRSVYGGDYQVLGKDKSIANFSAFEIPHSVYDQCTLEALQQANGHVDQKISLLNAKTLKPYSLLNRRKELIPVFVQRSN